MTGFLCSMLEAVATLTLGLLLAVGDSLRQARQAGGPWPKGKSKRRG